MYSHCTWTLTSFSWLHPSSVDSDTRLHFVRERLASCTHFARLFRSTWERLLYIMTMATCSGGVPLGDAATSCAFVSGVPVWGGWGCEGCVEGVWGVGGVHFRCRFFHSSSRSDTNPHHALAERGWAANSSSLRYVSLARFCVATYTDQLGNGACCICVWRNEICFVIYVHCTCM